MRTYDHGIDEQLIERTLQRFLDRGQGRIWRQISEKTPELSYLAGVALHSHYKAVCAAWGLHDDAALSKVRDLVSDVTTAILSRFSADEIHARMGFAELCMASVGADAEVLRSLAVAFSGRPHLDREGLTTAPYSHALTDALSALTVSDDEQARTAAQLAADEFNSPAVPPGSAWSPVPAAINAVVDRDEVAVGAAVKASNALYAEGVAPTSDLRAGAETLVNIPLSFVCRLARWRDMKPPESPYILAMDSKSDRL